MQYVVNYKADNGRSFMEQFDSLQHAIEYEDRVKAAGAVATSIRKVTQTSETLYHVSWSNRKRKKGYELFHDEEAAKIFYENKKTTALEISLVQETVATTRSRWTMC